MSLGLPTVYQHFHQSIFPKIRKLDVPGRPILRANDRPTKRISGLLDCTLRPLFKHTSFYIRDTTDVINKVTKLDLGTAGKEAILFSMDVTSLYPNIPQFEWIDCTLDLFGRHPPYILRLKVVKRLLEKVLTRNLTYNHFLVIVVIYNQSSMVTSLYSRTE